MNCDVTKSESEEATIRIAVVQMDRQVGRKDHNIRHSVARLRQAADNGTRLIVLPELCDSGYGFDSRDQVHQLAEPATDSTAIKAWAKTANQLGVYVVAGFCERDGEDYFNSAAVIGPDGLIGVYRKTHLYSRENLFFRPGNHGLPIFKLPFASIGVLICYDIRFPEAVRHLALNGADIICVPTNWLMPTGKKRDERGYTMQAYCAIAQASMSSVFIACADRIGRESTYDFLGGSIIAGNAGWPLAGPASADQEEILYADIDPHDARRDKQRNEFNHVWTDRRLDLYREP